MSHLSFSRIKTIMKSCAGVDCVSKESVMMLAKATELFIELLATAGCKDAKGAKLLDYKNLANVVHNEDRYEFLREIMPKKITVLEYKMLMAKQKGNKDGDDSESDSESDSSSSVGGGSEISEEEEEEEKNDGKKVKAEETCKDNPKNNDDVITIINSSDDE